MAIKNPCSLLDRLLRERGESTWLEFKRNYFDPVDIGEYVSALSNSAILNERDRAFIVFGVDNETKEMVGTDVRLKTKKVKGELFEHWLNRRIFPSIMINMEDFECDGKWFSIIEIEQTYECPVQFDKEEFIRIGEHKKKLRDNRETMRALWIATGKRKFESAIAKTNVYESTVLNLLDAETMYNLLNLPIPQGNKEILRKLEAMSAIVDNLDGYYDITNLGALLFARDVTLFPSIVGKSVRVIKYSGVGKDKAEYEKEGKMGYAAGFSSMIEYIVDHLPKREEKTNGVRRTVHDYPKEAITEFIANALIHQDFTIDGMAPLVEIFSNRVEISNPGSSLVREDRMFDVRRSRNKELSRRMRELGLCEERGSGLNTAIQAIESKGMTAPRFVSSEYSLRVVLWGPTRFEKMSREDKQRACYHHCVIRWLWGDAMNNASLRDRFRLKPSMHQAVSSIIREAVGTGRIIPEKKNQTGNGARYIPYWAGPDVEDQQ